MIYTKQTENLSDMFSSTKKNDRGQKRNAV